MSLEDIPIEARIDEVSSKAEFSAAQQEKFRQSNIDINLSTQILETLNQGSFSAAQKPNACGNFEIPTIDGKEIVDFSTAIRYTVDVARIFELLQQYPELEISSLPQYRKSREQKVYLSEQEIREVGLLLNPYFAFGVLNGGSASSYFDHKKNQDFSPSLYQLFQGEFQDLAEKFSHLPKALCPAFLQDPSANPGSKGPYGPSFMGLKLRSVLHTIRQERRLRLERGLAPARVESKLFQMTSQLTDEFLQNYASVGWKEDPAGLQPLVDELAWQPGEQIYAEQQPLLATFDKTDLGSWQFFCDRSGGYLSMPGGHGQCFFALRNLLQKFYDQGTRYISLGNIDNVAYNPQSTFVGLLALSGRESFFICSYRSSVDIKGGVLLRPLVTSMDSIDPTKWQQAKLNCFDIGVGVDKKILQLAEQEGKDLLFNCAIGYFDLGSLLQKIDDIILNLPLRISEQNKDKGHYWQVEQVTWEVMGLMNSVLIAAVHKEDHFLAAKLQLESFVNTAYRLHSYNDPQLEKLKELAQKFSQGYAKVLQRDCDYQMQAN